MKITNILDAQAIHDFASMHGRFLRVDARSGYTMVGLAPARRLLHTGRNSIGKPQLDCVFFECAADYAKCCAEDLSSDAELDAIFAR